MNADGTVWNFSAIRLKEQVLLTDFVIWVLSTAVDIQQCSTDLKMPLHVAHWQHGALDFWSGSTASVWPQDWQSGETHVICFLVSAHWLLMIRELTTDGFTVELVDGLPRARNPVVFTAAVDWFQRSLQRECGGIFFHGITQRLDSSSGTLMLLHLGMVFGLVGPRS